MSRPFDEVRYKGLLEGLEVTELSLAQVKNENAKLRIDSGFFAKPMIDADKKIRAFPGGYDELGRIFDRFVKGVFDINADCYAEAGVPFLRILNLRNGAIDDSNLALIPEDVHQAEKKTELRYKDIVLSKTAYPAASVVTIDRCNTSQDTIATTLSAYGKRTYTPEAIVAFLNSSLGERLLWRQFQGNVQLHLSLDDGRKVPMPRLGGNIQKEITRLFEEANKCRERAVAHALLADQVLLRGLGLESWHPPEPLTYIRRATEAFDAGRLDSDYFAPRVTELLKRLGAANLTIGAVAPSRRERFSPASRGEFDYIEIGSVRTDGTVGAERLPQSEAPSRATSFVRTGDVITSSVRPIRRLSAVITPEQNGFVCSSGFVVLQPLHVPAEVLLTFLRLPPVCELMDLHASASLYPAISEVDLLALPFHSVDKAAEAKIVKAVRAAHDARRKAHTLLKLATQIVEVAVEQGEVAAVRLVHDSAES